jgi:hypothetical protein
MDVNRPLSAWHFPLRKRKLLKKRTTASNSIPVGATNMLSDSNNRQQPPTTANNRQQPPATANNRQQPPTTANNRQQPPTTANNRQQPPTTATATTAITMTRSTAKTTSVNGKSLIVHTLRERNGERHKCWD